MSRRLRGQRNRQGLFGASAYKTYGSIIAKQNYDHAGFTVKLALKDAGLAQSAGQAAGVPLPSGNVWRDSLVDALAHGVAQAFGHLHQPGAQVGQRFGDGGQRSIERWARQHRLARVHFDETDAFFNANTPDDLRA